MDEVVVPRIGDNISRGAQALIPDLRTNRDFVEVTMVFIESDGGCVHGHYQLQFHCIMLLLLLIDCLLQLYNFYRLLGS